MKARDLNEVVKRDPIDRTAAMVTGRGIQYENPKRIAQLHWEIAPPTIPLGKGEEDLTGKTFGRFTVVGKFSSQGPSGKQAMWLVRCSCSHYETRRKRSILNPKNNADRCDLCRHLLFRKRERIFWKTGRDVDAAEI